MTTAAPRVVQVKRHLPPTASSHFSLQSVRQWGQKAHQHFSYSGRQRGAVMKASSQFIKDCGCRIYSRLSLVALSACYEWSPWTKNPRRTENKEIFLKKQSVYATEPNTNSTRGLNNSLTNEVPGTFWAGWLVRDRMDLVAPPGPVMQGKGTEEKKWMGLRDNKAGGLEKDL